MPSAPPSTITSRLRDDNGDEGEVSWATGRSPGASLRRASLAPLSALKPSLSPLSLDQTAAVLPLLSPVAQSAAHSPARPYFPGQPRSLAGIAVRAFGLGAALAAGAMVMAAEEAQTSSPLRRLPFFLSALSAFHFLEFWATAAYNTPAAGVASFLLSANWPAYAIAHAAAALECLVTR